MSHYTYILHSTTINKYYVGFTSDDLQERLRKHNTNHKGFNGGVGDWEIVYTETFDSATEARQRELQIKKWKSNIMIQKLIMKHRAAGSEHPDL
ncbi:MAG: GIY-YIG nuclease family protein [Bacteroidetes bacterium]|nr:GIY-YIG nuclease family protein [Bacteroidota bacterium]